MLALQNGLDLKWLNTSINLESKMSMYKLSVFEVNRKMDNWDKSFTSLYKKLSKIE